jgi:hypothetical protein
MEGIKTNFRINYEPTGKRGGKFELDQKLCDLISSGEGVNFTLFNKNPGVLTHVVDDETKINSYPQLNSVSSNRSKVNPNSTKSTNKRS